MKEKLVFFIKETMPSLGYIRTYTFPRKVWERDRSETLVSPRGAAKAAHPINLF